MDTGLVTNMPPWDVLGARVVVRRRLPAPDEFGHRLTDAVGEIVDLQDDRITVRTRRGDVTIERSTIVAAKQIPPPPPRRAREDRP